MLLGATPRALTIRGRRRRNKGNGATVLIGEALENKTVMNEDHLGGKDEDDNTRERF